MLDQCTTEENIALRYLWGPSFSQWMPIRRLLVAHQKGRHAEPETSSSVTTAEKINKRSVSVDPWQVTYPETNAALKCEPQSRQWPDKCDRCKYKGFRCSPSSRKQRGAGRVLISTSLEKSPREERSTLQVSHDDAGNNPSSPAQSPAVAPSAVPKPASGSKPNKAVESWSLQDLYA